MYLNHRLMILANTWHASSYVRHWLQFELRNDTRTKAEVHLVDSLLVTTCSDLLFKQWLYHLASSHCQSSSSLCMQVCQKQAGIRTSSHDGDQLPGKQLASIYVCLVQQHPLGFPRRRKSRRWYCAGDRRAWSDCNTRIRFRSANAFFSSFSWRCLFDQSFWAQTALVSVKAPFPIPSFPSPSRDNTQKKIRCFILVGYACISASSKCNIDEQASIYLFCEITIFDKFLIDHLILTSQVIMQHISTSSFAWNNGVCCFISGLSQCKCCLNKWKYFLNYVGWYHIIRWKCEWMFSWVCHISHKAS